MFVRPCFLPLFCLIELHSDWMGTICPPYCSLLSPFDKCLVFAFRGCGQWIAQDPCLNFTDVFSSSKALCYRGSCTRSACHSLWWPSVPFLHYCLIYLKQNKTKRPLMFAGLQQIISRRNLSDCIVWRKVHSACSSKQDSQSCKTVYEFYSAYEFYWHRWLC